MEKNYSPLNCPEFQNGCDSSGVCECLERTGLDYRGCTIHLDKTQERIKLFGRKLK